MIFRRFPRFRFSLRTALLAVLLIGAGLGLWWHWAPWNVRQLNHGEFCRNAEFSPDSKLAFTDGVTSIKIWDTSSGACRQEIVQPDYYHRATWDPRGARIASIYDENSVRIWDAQTAVSLREIIETEPYRVASIDFVPDGTRLLIFSRKSSVDDERIRLIETDSGKAIAEFGDTDHFRSFSPDGRFILFSHFVPNYRGDQSPKKPSEFKNGFSLCDAHTGGRVWFVAERENHSFRHIAFSGDGQRIVCGEEEWAEDPEPAKGVIPQTTVYDCVWDAKDGQLISRKKIREGFIGFNTTVSAWTQALSPDGAKKVIRESNRLTIYDAHTEELLTVLPGVKLSASSSSAEFAPDCKHILAGDYLFQSHCWLISFRRPEQWWGIAWLPEFWATLVFGAAFIWSLARDRRQFANG